MTKYNLYSDLELLDLFKLGEDGAFTEIYDRYFGLLYLHAVHKLRDKDEAKDLIQDIFSELWSSRKSLEMKTNFSNYLYTTVRNRILNLIAHKGVEERYRLSLCKESNSESLTDFRIRERQLSDFIEREIDKLPPKMKTVFLMSRKSNMTYIEISRDLDITTQSVRSHVKNALKILRVKFGMLVYILPLFY